MTGFEIPKSAPSLSILHLSVTADIVAQLNPRADVEKCAVFTQKKARPALDHRADGGGEGGHGGAEAEGYGVGAAVAGARPVGGAAVLGISALTVMVIVRFWTD